MSLLTAPLKFRIPIVITLIMSNLGCSILDHSSDMEEVNVNIELVTHSIPFNSSKLNVEFGSRAISLSIEKSSLEEIFNVAKSRSLKVHKFGFTTVSIEGEEIITQQISFFPPVEPMQSSTNAEAWNSVIYVSRGKNSSLATLRLLGQEIVFVPIRRKGIYKLKLFLSLSAIKSNRIEVVAYSQDINIKVDPKKPELELFGE